MVKEEIINKCYEFAQSCSKDNEPGHDFHHILRVRNLALKLANNYEADKFVVELLALLHDVEDHKLHSRYSVSTFLNSVDVDKNIKNKIIYILPFLSFSKYPTLPKDFPIEGKIISDADRLDAIGAVGVARAFSYGGANKRDFKETLKHFEEKLLVLDQYLYLDESKEIALKRMKYLKDFYNELLVEL